jgi:hypothetical protein
MRNKRHLPLLLALAVSPFPHAMHAKGKGAPALEPPPMNPPGGTGAPPVDDASTSLQGYLAESNPGYFSEYERNKNRPNSGDTRTFGTWLKDHLNATPDDALWQDSAVSTYAKGGSFTAPTKDAPGDTPPVAPPAPTLPPPIDTGAGLNLGAPTMPTLEKPAPPVSDKSSEVRDAGREARRKAGRRKGYLSTLLAGESGGYTGQAKTLLGQP